MIVVWSADALEQVRVEATDLVDARGHRLGRDAIRLQLVRYVLSDHPAGARRATCDAGQRETAWLLPDRLEPLDRFDMPARTVRPVVNDLDRLLGSLPNERAFDPVHLEDALKRGRLAVTALSDLLGP